MPSKQRHTKSRRGCGQCKQRRIKCDERPPCCGSCEKKGIECDYRELRAVPHSIQVLTQASFLPSSRLGISGSSNRTPSLQSLNGRSSAGSPASQSTTSSSSDRTRTTAPSELQAGGPNHGFCSEDMFLLHHYTLYTSRTIGLLDREEFHTVWQTRVPKMAYPNPFLMHAMLSITAAHQSRTELCRQHYSKAIESFTTIISTTVSRPYEAMYCYCILIMLITFYLECKEQSDSSLGTGIYNFFASMRTAVAMISTFKAELREQNIGCILRHLHVPPTPKIIPDVVRIALDGLDQLIDVDPTMTAEKAHALHDATFHLRHFYTLIDPIPQTWTHMLSWITNISPNYLTLLQHNDPAALAIFAHWCVPVHNAPQKWFIGDWPRRVILEVSRMLVGTVWEASVQWPTSQIIRDSFAS